jgi:flagellar assembly protein FliH
MSSFKIERHRVRLIPPDMPQVQIQNGDGHPPQPSDADVERLYAEIFERLSREHAEQAELILEEAGERARAAIEEAKSRAEAIVADAAAQAERLKAEAEEKMRAEEERRAAAFRKQCEEETSRREAEFRALTEELRGRYQALVDEIEEGVVPLVMEIVRKVIGVKLSQSDAVFMGLVREGIERLRQQGTATIRVSPEDYARYFGQRSGWQDQFETGEMKLAAAADSGLSPGDLIIDTEFECIDLSINRQLREIEEALSE